MNEIGVHSWQFRFPLSLLNAHLARLRVRAPRSSIMAKHNGFLDEKVNLIPSPFTILSCSSNAKAGELEKSGFRGNDEIHEGRG